MGFSLLVDGKRVRLDGRLPVLPLRDVVLFPGMVLPLFVGRPASVEAIRRSQSRSRLLLAVAQRRPEVALPRRSDLYDVGVVVRVRQVLSLPDGTMRVLVEGIERARLVELRPEGPFLEAEIRLFAATARPAPRTLELLHEVKSSFLEYARADRRIPEEVVLSVATEEDPLEASYRMAAHLTVRLSARQELLECAGASERLHLLARLLASESEIVRLGQRIEAEGTTQARRESEAEPRRAPRRAWKGEPDETEAEQSELAARIAAARMPPAAREKARRELERLGKMAALSPEATVARTYLDWLLALPWAKRTRDRTDIEAAQAILDEDHHGLVAVKERILEQIAVMRLTRKMRGPVLCLMGPPGVGKTSLGRSVARALNRRFVRMSLGGVRDEAEIRGHRRTYIGSLPGRILQAMRRAGTVNPVILLDEVDKLGLDYRGDPAAALLEVLDPEQNHAFNDHYLEVDYDLSRVLFLTTANTATGIPPALRDRMEVIRLPGYLETEKLAIAERFLLPRQRAAAGLDPSALSITREAMTRIVREYTREAGVRSLEREIARICRRTARERATGRPEERSGRIVGPGEVEALLGVPRFLREEVERRDRIGLATGLAWSEAGGALLPIEVGVLPGRGRLILTGKLGPTMKESARAALSCVRSRAEGLGLDPLFHRTMDIHLHIPEGEVPKDGPSAGSAIALAMVSALLRVPTRESVAVTGELTLRGQVLPVGGLSEKAIAALRAGVKTILFPSGNERHLSEIPEEVRSGLAFVPVSSFDQILRRALARRGRSGGSSARTGPRSAPRSSALVLPAAAGAPAARSTRADAHDRLRKAA